MSDVFKLDDPEVLPTGNGMSTAFSSDGMYMSVAHAVSPFITIYKRDGDVFTKLPNPTGGLPPNTGRSTAFSPCSTYMSVAHSTSPFITIYKRDGDVFTKLPNPTGGLPPNTGNSTAFSPDGMYMSVAHAVSPFITIYKRDGDVFTKLANPTGGLPAGTGRGTAFSPDGAYMSVAHGNAPFITIYKRDGDVFTKLDNPTVLPANHGRGTAFSPDGVHVSVAHRTSPFITIYKRDGDVFTKLDNPTILPAGDGNSTAFSPCSTYMSVAHDNTPYITIYRRDGDVFTKIPDLTTVLPTGTGNGAAFSPDGVYMSVAHSLSPYVSIYDTSAFAPIPVLRSKGLLGLSANFEPQMSAPLDARHITNLRENLIKHSTWEIGGGETYAYKGMCTAVVNDNEYNNGFYILTGEDYTDFDNWRRLDPGAEEYNIPQDDIFMTTTLAPGGWSGSNPFTKTISAPRMKLGYVPICDLRLESLNHSQRISAIAAWKKIYRIDYLDGAILFYATEPINDVSLDLYLKVMSIKSEAKAPFVLISGITHNSVTLAGGSHVRLKKESDANWGGWQTSPHMFTGLSSLTDYEAQAILQQTSVSYASPISRTMFFRTL